MSRRTAEEITVEGRVIALLLRTEPFGLGNAGPGTEYKNTVRLFRHARDDRPRIGQAK
jgi:hypothetical protein